jgi:phage terminase small subunit
MPKVSSTDSWTDKERLFAHEYLIDQSMTQAAIRAGYSERSAKKIGHQVYHKPHIKAWIEAELAKRYEKAGVTADKVIKELAELGFIKRDEVLSAGRSPDDEGLPPMTLLSTMRMTDKIRALELIGKNLKMWIDRVETDESPRNTVIVRDLTGKKKKGAD